MDPKTQGLPEGYKPGLEGVIAGVSEICDVDPEQDALIYRGYPAHELAEHSNFPEVAYLLLHGTLPTKIELEEFRHDLIRDRDVPPTILSIMKQIPKNANPMTRLRMATSILHMYDPDRGIITESANHAKAKRLIAKTATLVAAGYRLAKGEEPIPPNPDMDHAENFLYMLTGKEPEADIARLFDQSLVLYAEHGYNASTFATLITASTLSDMYSCIASAIGTLKGPLHGGANEKAIEMLLEIGEEKKVEPWLKAALARKEKIMGFGHRVYRKQDSRAPLMKKLAETVANKLGDTKLFDLSIKLEDLMKKEKGLFPNVDYHCAVFYYLIGLSTPLFTPIFAMARMAGWTAHIIEQQQNNRLIRPHCLYTGPRGLSYIPIEMR
ncbi:MAG: citrate synthase [Elusimicrobia bacterium]|nr:citrate synthase [Candidatus Obscuribacterium magneticum]